MKKIWIVAIALIVGGFLGLYIGYARSPTTSENSSASISSSSPASADLSANMRQLGENQITWTRMYLIDVASANGFADADLNRLMKNAKDIGNAFQPYYGNTTRDTVTKLLKQNISDMVAFAKATKAQDTHAQSAARTDLDNNANQVADFLAKTNSNLTDSDMRFMMQSYLNTTRQEALDIFSNKYQPSVADYDKVHQQMLQIADTLSIGIRQQFPERF